jgi:hypothetical protein
VGKVSKAKKERKRNWEGGGEKTKLQKSTEIRAEKGQTKKLNLGWHRDRKENPISAPSIHVGALMGAGSLRPALRGERICLTRRTEIYCPPLLPQFTIT